MVDATIAIAFVAGLVSFLSPCVLPLVPGYLSYMSGFGQLETIPRRRAMRTGTVALLFVVGFTVVFIALGATATLLGASLRDHREALTQIGGVFIVVLGLIFMGVIKVPFFYREARFHPTPKAGLWGSFVLGSAFAFGWSPCIGPTMGLALTMAAGRGSTGGAAEGAMLLGIYSLGLGIPFVLAGLGVSHLSGTLNWLKNHTRRLNLVSGILLVAVGLLFVTGDLFRLSIWMQKTFTALNLDFWSGL
jgi:cytochrome c-type biogenesis protein